MKFSISTTSASSEKLSQIEEFEKANDLTLPSDYRWLLLNHNELRLSNDAMGMILDPDGEEVSGLDGPLFSLESFKFSSDPYPCIEFVNRDTAKRAADDFFVIATLFYQGILLIGKSPLNENEIHAFVPEYKEAPFFVAKSIETLFNNVLHIIE